MLQKSVDALDFVFPALFAAAHLFFVQGERFGQVVQLRQLGRVLTAYGRQDFGFAPGGPLFGLALGVECPRVTLAAQLDLHPPGARLGLNGRCHGLDRRQQNWGFLGIGAKTGAFWGRSWCGLVQSGHYIRPLPFANLLICAG
ncbi:hypothetical protein D3C72_1637920 [compost metagenome]